MACHTPRKAVFFSCVVCKFILLGDLLGPRENNMSVRAVLARNLCSQTSQTFTLHIYMFFPCAQWKQWKQFLWWHSFSIWPIPCVGCWQRVVAHCIPREIFHLKVITIVRCGVVLVSGIFVFNEMITEVHFKQLWIITFVQFQSEMSKVRVCKSYCSPLREDERNLSLLRAVRDLWWL